jgi:predicted transcriptional regulator
MTGQFRAKVLASIRNEERRRKGQQREEFAQTYDKLKTGTLLKGEKANMDRFVVIPKDIFSYGLSKAALAVYPVLCSKADFDQDSSFQISQDNIALLTGISIAAVKRATDELEEAGLLIREKVSEGSRHFYVYSVYFIRRPMLEKEEHKGNKVFFYTCLVEGGIWAKLKPRAKALYLALRVSAEQDLELYSSIESSESGEFYEPMEYDEYIHNRKWDVCSLSLAELCRLANIAAGDIQPVLAELEHRRLRLIERVGRWTKVYLKPRI